MQNYTSQLKHLILVKIKCSFVLSTDVITDNFKLTPKSIYLEEGRQSNIVSFEADTKYITSDGRTVPVNLNSFQVSIWGSKESNGEGPRRGLQTSVPTAEFSIVSTLFDMSGLTCSDVPYFCAEFHLKEPSTVQMEKKPVISCFPVRDGDCTGM